MRDGMNATKQRADAVRDALIDWLDREKLDGLTIEGHPDLRLTESQTYEYALPRMAVEAPDALLTLAREGVLQVSVKALRKAVGESRLPLDSPIAKYRTPKSVTRKLVFGEEDADDE